MAGAVAKKMLERHKIEVLAHVVQIGDVKMKKQPTIRQIQNNVYSNPIRCAIQDVTVLMEQAIFEAKKNGDSIGGIIEGVVINLPPGIGQPIFDTLDGDLAKALFSIPAVKGVEFGVGFKAARLRGSQNNDAYSIKDNQVVTLTNNSGGILGGLSTGMPIITRIAFKPTPSIAKPQQSVDMKNRVETEIRIKGRHDACIVPRAVPVVESMIAITLADHLLTLGTLSR
jgi:chorismate synthase